MLHKVEHIQFKYTKFPMNLFPTKRRKELERCILLWEPKKIVSQNFQFPWNRLSNGFCSNIIVTHQYTLLTFIPKNIWQQFHKLSNVYFLCIAILQTAPKVSATNGIPTILLPFAFVLTVNALKDAYEDWNRYKADREENNQRVLRLLHPISLLGRLSHNFSGPPSDTLLTVENESESDFCPSQESLAVELVKSPSGIPIDYFLPKRHQSLLRNHSDLRATITQHLMYRVLEEINWGEIQVGDFLFLTCGERLPADIILLGCSDSYGVVYVETANLDGETNWKPKQALHEIAELIGTQVEKALQRTKTLRGFLTCSSLSPSLESFEGFLHVNINGVNKKIALTSNQLLLRGSKMCYTAWAVGIVVYTGVDTKIMLGSPNISPKNSHLELFINKIALCVFLLQLGLCLVATLGSYTSRFYKQYSRNHFRVFREPIDLSSFILWFFMWLVFFSNMIPISLIVTQSIVKTIQGLLISFDMDMYHSSTESHVVVRRSNLNDELGCITHILSDKTGTLTYNNMEFRKCCIHGICYGQANLSRSNTGLKNENSNSTTEFHFTGLPKDYFKLTTPQVSIVDKRLDEKLEAKKDPEHTHVLDFFLNLAVNHSVLIKHCHDIGILYEGISSDEQSLVYGASHFGIKLLNRQNQQELSLSVLNKNIQVRVLAFFEFTDLRKRTSALIHLPANAQLEWPQERYILFCKGADSLVLPRCDQTSSDVRENITQALNEYAYEGLRTLCVAKRELSRHFTERWYKDYIAVLNTSTNKKKETLRMAEELEQSMELQGVVGIEDKIQDGVQDTIQALTAAGINIWMLTGDKLETAVNIGSSIGLLRKDGFNLVYEYDPIKTNTNDTVTLSSSFAVSKERSPDSTVDSNMKCYKLSGLFHQQLQERLLQDIVFCKKINQEKEKCTVGQTFSLKQNNIHGEAQCFVSRILVYIGNFIRIWTSKDNPLLFEKSSREISLIIEGACLSEVLKPELRNIFLQLCSLCSTVICSRTSPTQKSQVVELVKELDNSVTLAIGDGANDCNMLQRADVGVGIRGGEGLQAFNVSDYGVAQFSFLKILLLCHGRWCYRRVSFLVLYMFYKNLVIVLPIFYFSFFSEFAGNVDSTQTYLVYLDGSVGAKLYFDLVYQLFNILFTSIPVFVFAIFEQDTSKANALAHPELYSRGKKSSNPSKNVLLCWLLRAVLHSLILFMFSMFFFYNNVSPATSQPMRLYVLGHTIYITVLITINLKLLLQTTLVTWVNWVSFVFSIFTWFTVMVALSSSPTIAPSCLAVLYAMLQTPLFYINLIVAPLIAISFEHVCKAFTKFF